MKGCCAMMCALVAVQAAVGTQYAPLGQASADDDFVKAIASIHATGALAHQPSIYDTLQFELTITPSAGVAVKDIELASEIGDEFYVAGGVGTKVQDADGVTRYSATLEPLAGGELTIGPIEIVYTTKGLEGEIESTLELEAMHVTIAGAIDAEAEAPAGLKDRLDAPKGVPWGWIVAGGGVVAMGAVAIAAVAWRKKQDALPPPPRPAHELALEALDGLENEGFLERGQVEVFLAKCSDILRRYIGARFGIDAPDRTTEEFLQEAARSKQLNVGDVVLLEGFLTKIDLVKFAKRPASADEGREAAVQARSFVEETAEKAEVGA